MSETAERDEEFRMLADHLGILVQELEQDPTADERVTEVLRHTLALYGEAMKRILELVRANPVGEITLGQMAEDEVISSVLLIHGLFPVSLETRIRQALEGIQPRLEAHDARVELLQLEGDKARLRVTGPGGRLESSMASLQLMVRQTLEQAVPDLMEVEIEGVLDSRPASPSFENLVQIDDAASRPESAPTWVEVAREEELSAGRLKAVEIDGTSILLCRVENGILAFKNVCSHRNLPMDKGLLRGNELTCPWHGYRYDVSRQGVCLNAPELNLQSFPVKIEKGVVKVNLPKEG